MISDACRFHCTAIRCLKSPCKEARQKGGRNETFTYFVGVVLEQEISY